MQEVGLRSRKQGGALFAVFQVEVPPDLFVTPDKHLYWFLLVS